MICNLCLGQEYIYVYMSVSWHLPLVRVQKFINIVIFLCYYHSKSCPKNLLILSLSLCYLFFPTFFFFASLEHFMNAKSEAVPNDFSPRVIFCWGGMYLSNIHWHLKPIQIFPGVWRNMGRTALFYMGPWRILFWINSCLNTDEKCQIYMFIAFSGKDNWMGCKSWHFYASEILSIIFKKINDDARVWSSRNLTACYCKMHLQFIFQTTNATKLKWLYELI